MPDLDQPVGYLVKLLPLLDLENVQKNQKSLLLVNKDILKNAFVWFGFLLSKKNQDTMRLQHTPW